MRNCSTASSFLLVAFYIATVLVTASAGEVSDYNVVVTATHRDAGESHIPDCSQYHDRAQAAIQDAFDDHYSRRRSLFLRRRSLQANETSVDNDDEYETYTCSDICRNVVAGYCFWATGGICSSPNRRLMRVEGTQLVTTLCGQRPMLVQSALEKLGRELHTRNECRDYFHGPWETDCFAIA